MMVALPLTIMAQTVVIFDAEFDVVPYICVSGCVLCGKFSKVPYMRLGNNPCHANFIF